MDAVGIVLMGIGGFLMFEAYKSKDPTPVVKARTVLNSAQGTTPTKG
jgi:hypothetical protein